MTVFKHARRVLLPSCPSQAKVEINVHSAAREKKVRASSRNANDLPSFDSR